MSTLSSQQKYSTVSAKSNPSRFPSKFIRLAISSLAMSLSMTGVASAAAIRAGFDSNTLARNDDGSTGLVNLGFTANFLGTNYTQTYVNNNGNLTFNAPLGQFTPTLITGGSAPIIAPFFADVDTRSAGSSLVSYGRGIINGNAAFAANYVNVGYFPSATNKLNSFQVVLINRNDTGTTGNFDIEFNYDRIQWETGGASGGVNGLGGTPARAGYSNGAGTFYEFTGSGVSGAFLDGGSNSLIANSLNSDVLGRYTFNARNGAVVTPPTTSVPEPFTIVGTLVGGTAAMRMRKKLKVTKK
jgi:Nidogen-like